MRCKSISQYTNEGCTIVLTIQENGTFKNKSHCIFNRTWESNDTKRQAVEYLGGKCNRCGLITTYYEVYDFHHIDPTTKSFTIATRLKNYTSFKTLKKELDKCMLLCANCHRIIEYNKTNRR